MSVDDFNTSKAYKNFTIEQLQHFIIRARIVQDHSLARDFGKLRNLSTYRFNMDFQKDLRTGETTVRFRPVDLLPTEQVESAAARVRPVFLFSDGIYYADVLAYIYENVDDTETREKALRLLKECQSADPDHPISTKGKTYEPGSGVNNKELAGAWLYGSLLHEDQRRRSFSEQFYLEEVYFNATVTVASMMLCVVQILHFIEHLQTRGLLDVPSELWSDAVTVTVSEWTRPGVGKVYTAPVGTAPPADLSVDMDSLEEWSEFDPLGEFGHGSR
ncbi:hypothetical protein [Rothia nasimurium]|uniref:hypothetical protein n=1 Tax=Rothia nasimurium TaxID=85336 RepID=UPI0016276C13|nr:hypothetical protein [Rothia nasimurium]